MDLRKILKLHINSNEISLLLIDNSQKNEDNKKGLNMIEKVT